MDKIIFLIDTFFIGLKILIEGIFICSIVFCIVGFITVVIIFLMSIPTVWFMTKILGYILIFIVICIFIGCMKDVLERIREFDTLD